VPDLITRPGDVLLDRNSAHSKRLTKTYQNRAI
jgi:hypothetical protein